MTNNTWNKLCNEWRANNVNEEFRALCNRVDVDPNDISARKSIEMKYIRKECKKQYVWLEDSCESDIYVELMPMGGYTRQALQTLKECIDKYRTSGRSNSVYHAIVGGV